jgi:hypothetical protein
MKIYCFKVYQHFRLYATSRKVALMALGSTQLLTEMSTRNLPGGKGRLALNAENLTAICEPIV